MAIAFSVEEKKERIRQAMEIFGETGSWSNADTIVRRQSVEKWIRNPELHAYAMTLGYQQLCTAPIAAFAPESKHPQCRMSFSGAMVHLKEGRYLCRDGARLHYAYNHGQLVMYKLDGAGTRHHAGPAYFRGADVLAADWVIVK